MTTTVPVPVQNGIRSASRGLGLVTSRARMTPDFLIVGAQRCGTTSLYRTLVEHPSVLPAVLHKGVHYFDTAYTRSPRWYRGHFPLQATARRTSTRTGSRTITGEASPYYMFHPAVPARIANDLPDVKLIALLRDPVERAYSAHTHELARGFDTLPFEEALEAEEDRLAGEEIRLLADPGFVSHAHQHQAYVDRGRYVEQLDRMASLVGRDRLLVLDADDFFADPYTGLADVQRFLDLPQWQPARVEKRNARPRAPMPAALRSRLEADLEPWDELLAAWWGRTPSWRR
ncbi:MAG: sulfotransferase domain-containing protein [Nocardioidaceae bacterium]